MFKITNIESIGNDYTVSDQTGKLIKKIQVMTQKDILDAALGEYNSAFDSVASYLEKSIAVLSGFEEVDPNRILWYTSFDEEIIISEIIEFAVEHGYDKIILEHLEELD